MPENSQILKLKDFFVPRNTYKVAIGDILWLYKNAEEDSLHLIKGLIKRRFTNVDLRRYNKQRFSLAARNFIVRNPDSFSVSLRGTTDYYNEFLQISQVNYDEIINKFKDIIRGFNNVDIGIEKRYVNTDRRRFLKTIDECLTTNRKLQRIAQKKGHCYKDGRYAENIRNLGATRKTVIEKFNNRNECAKLRCTYKVMEHRQWNIVSRFLAKQRVEADYLNINLILEKCNPLLVTFPLQFMLCLKIGHYRELLNAWEDTQDKDNIIRALESEIRKDKFFSSIYSMFRRNTLKICKKRLALLKEIKFLYQNKRYNSCSLLTATQIEGMLWDLGNYLTKKRKFIFKVDRSRAKPKFFVYRWDKRNKKYRDMKPSRYPEHFTGRDGQLVSARQLLSRTRLIEFIPKEIANYIIDDFSDLRNELTHGGLKHLNKKETASYALLLLYPNFRS